MTTYEEFLAAKRVLVPDVGLRTVPRLNKKLFPFQREIVGWALRRGRAAIFADCGLGKSAMQLEWARVVAAHTGGRVLILAPLAVAAQTVREGAKFGIPVEYAREQGAVKSAIVITNYEMLEHFDASSFAGVVLDESSILKSFMGATKRRLLEAFAATPFRLACTATPAPNDHLELGNHAEFLGVLTSHEMIARWFINDTCAELGRLVLLDDVPANGESFFVARAFHLLRREGLAAVTSFSDPKPRSAVDGRLVMPGHVGTIYQSLGASYLGFARADTLRLLPDGKSFPNRAATKIRRRQKGYRGRVDVLVGHGAAPLGDHEDAAAWLAFWLARLTRPHRRACLKYALAVDPRARRHLPESEKYLKLGDPGAPPARARRAA